MGDTYFGWLVTLPVRAGDVCAQTRSASRPPTGRGRLAKPTRPVYPRSGAIRPLLAKRPGWRCPATPAVEMILSGTGIGPDLDPLQPGTSLRSVASEIPVDDHGLLRQHGLQVTAQR